MRRFAFGELATLAVASWNQILGWLQEVHLLREAAPRMAAIPLNRAAQPENFIAPRHPLAVLESVS